MQSPREMSLQTSHVTGQSIRSTWWEAVFSVGRLEVTRVCLNSFRSIVNRIDDDDAKK